MSYATRDDMVARFGEREVLTLTDRAFAGLIDDAVLSDALGMAANEIDGYIAGRYPLPMATPPRVLAGFACDIARYRLCGAGTQTTDEIRDRYRDAVRFLEHVAAGRVSLGGMPEGSAAAPAQSVHFMQGGRVFGRDASW